MLSLLLHKKLYYPNQAGKPPLLCWQKRKVHLLVNWFLFSLLFSDHFWAQRRALSDTTHVQGRDEQVKGGPAAGSPLRVPGRCPCTHHPHPRITPQGAWTSPPHPPSSPIRGWQSLSYTVCTGVLQRYLQDGDATEKRWQLATNLPDPALEIPGFTLLASAFTLA